MSQPTPYVRAYNFANQQAITPSAPLRGDMVDLELNQAKVSLDQTQSNLALIQRDDGALRNASVGLDQLKAEVEIGVNPPTAWLTLTNFVVRDTVTNGSSFYRCLISHVSGTFATDLAAGKWVLIADFSTAISTGAIANSIHAASTKAILVDNDEFGGTDSEGAYGLRRFTWAAVKAAIFSAWGTLVAAATAKATPVDGDSLVLSDSASANATKKVLWSDIKATLRAYLLTIFAVRTPPPKSLIVNGSMQISQENGNTLGTTNGYYPADQWALYFTAATAAMSAQRIQARTLARATDQIEFKTTTAKAVLAAGDSVTLTQNIEGSYFADAGFGTAAAVQVVLEAENALPAGLYHWHFQNSAGTRHCAIPFTVPGGEANVAKRRTIIVPPDTSGTWLTAEGAIGITSDLVLAAGSSKTGGSASTWGVTAYYAASAQKNILDSTANVARLADVGLKLDPDATGVCGTYEVGEVDPVYRSERYVWNKLFAANNAVGTLMAYSTTSAFGLFSTAPFKMAKSSGFTIQNSSASELNIYNATGTNAVGTGTLGLVATALGDVVVTQLDRSGGGLIAGNAVPIYAGAGGFALRVIGRLS